MNITRNVGTLLVTCVLVAACIAPARSAVDCKFGVASGVAFGNYDPFAGGATTSNGTLDFHCTGVGSGTVEATVDLSKGSSPTYTPRTMLNGLTAMNYNLYVDSFGLVIWGDGTGGSFPYGPFGVANNQTVTLTIYGQIPAGQDLPPGSYSDTITASVNF